VFFLGAKNLPPSDKKKDGLATKYKRLFFLGKKMLAQCYEEKTI
jgi:hypothetical protein